jgi:UDP:flavonoid glycosyltransferase YjiC (YdhE family)
LSERGHVFGFVGQAEQRNRIEAARLNFVAYEHHPELEAAAAVSPQLRQRALLTDVWKNVALLTTCMLASRASPDVVVVDCMLLGVLQASATFDVPTVVLVHSLFNSVLAMRSAFVATGNQLLAKAGREPLNPEDVAWESKDLALITTLRELDGVTADPGPHIRYVGPVFERSNAPQDWHLPWERDDPRPLVLVSFSTMPGQTAPGTPQLVLDVPSNLPVCVLMTTGALPSSLHLAVHPNAAVYEFVPHSAVLLHAAIAINHV